MQDDNTYSTTDFHTTAVLISQGFEVLSVVGEKDNRIKRFKFEDSQELRETVRLFLNGKLEGNLRDYKNAINCVKDMLHS